MGKEKKQNHTTSISHGEVIRERKESVCLQKDVLSSDNCGNLKAVTQQDLGPARPCIASQENTSSWITFSQMPSVEKAHF